MKATLSELSLELPLPQRTQISQYLRELIVSGRLTPGERMPSTQEMASLWSTNVLTVHKALTQLAREGLVMRVNRVGTFVRQREEKLTRVGIFIDQRTWAEPAFAYRRAVAAALQTELAHQTRVASLIFDARSEEHVDELLPTLMHAANRREIQSLIALDSGEPRLPWLRTLPVPVAYLGGDEPSSVGNDFQKLFELGLGALAQQGCRSVGLISHASVTETEFYDMFTELSRDFGLTFKNFWVRPPNSPLKVSQEQFGYDQFHQLWAQPERPDGLIVTPDSIARGAITAMLERRVNVPNELKLVLQKNETIELLCPFPAAFVVNSERQVARLLIAQVEKQFRGEQCAPALASFRLGTHAGNGQREINQPTDEGN